MNPATTNIGGERDRPPGPFGQAGFDRLACAFPFQAVAAILFVLSATSGLQADHNKLLQLEFKRGISRHLARDSQGFCYLLLPTPGREDGLGFTLKVSRKPHPESIADFSTTVMLPTSAFSDAAGTSIFSAGLAVDGRDQLHLVCTTERGQTAYSVVDVKLLRGGRPKPRWLNPANGRKGSLVIAAARSWVGDICSAFDGRVWLTWTTGATEGSQVTVHLGTLCDGTWRSFVLGRGKKLYPPSLLISRDGAVFHVACGDTVGATHYLRGRIADLNTEREWRLERSHSGNRPALAELSAERILAAHESGDSLKYTFLATGEKVRRSHPLTDLDSRLTWDTVHSPRLVVDQYGVPWVFFIDSTRQHVFYSRWLGTRWSPILNGYWLTRNTARFEDNHLSIDWLDVEYGFGTDKSSIGLVIGHRGPFPDASFHVLRVPSLTSEAGHKALFLDVKEVQHSDGVKLKVNTASKRDAPVIVGGRRTDFDSQGAANVAVVKQDGVYRAWYSGLYRKPGSEWPKGGAIPKVRVGYAESADGIHFKKKSLGLSSFGANDHTNIVAGLPATPIFRPIVPTGMHIDVADPDPDRRYKFLTWTGGRPVRKRGGTGKTVDEQTWTLWTSPDGLRWRESSRGGIRYPGGMPSSFSPQSMFHDPDETDPARKYKAYGFLGLNNDRRGAGYGYSSDAIEWTADPRNPVFDAWARARPVVRNGKVEQIHDVVVWKYHQYYLALYQYQRSGEEMTIELAMSRDGENFSFIEPGNEVIRRGDPGQWDSDSIAPSVPLVDDDEIKLYYSGYRFSRTKRIEGERACGLATVRLDGFTHVDLEDGRDRGSVTTIPVARGGAAELHVNLSCAKGSRIEVELIDSRTGRAIPGFSRGDCSPITTDSLAHRVRWGKRSLADVLGASFQIRFHFVKGRESPRLYSFGFRAAIDK
ncbi:MAG TPA: hypothetical protein DCE39_17365 [Planctomycetaceae bacterium]|nr:hypothetical protein [Planctomycetaceae bacterium]